jgi:hypothetical protein
MEMARGLAILMITIVVGALLLGALLAGAGRSLRRTGW